MSIARAETQVNSDEFPKYENCTGSLPIAHTKMVWRKVSIYLEQGVWIVTHPGCIIETGEF